MMRRMKKLNEISDRLNEDGISITICARLRAFKILSHKEVQSRWTTTNFCRVTCAGHVACATVNGSSSISKDNPAITLQI